MLYGRKSNSELIPNYVTVTACRLNCLVGFIQVKERPLQVVRKEMFLMHSFIVYASFIQTGQSTSAY